MKWSAFLVAAVFAALTVGVWAWFNQPVMEPPWPSRVQGMAFSPFYSGQDPVIQVLPTQAQIEADLQLLADKVTAVRTYSALKSLASVPAVAEKHQLKVAIGAWVDRNRITSEQEIDAAVALAKTHSNVIRVVIGNEAILRGDLTVAELAQHLDRVRAEVAQPVSTAEPWHVWISHPELADHVDFIMVHLLPYWEGVHVEKAIEYIDMRMQQLQAAFPDKRIIIGEVGWPSDGRTREAAVASTSNEALFLRRFLQRAREEGYVYYIMEAFDQPWKAQYEGAVGAYWGVYDVHRRPKFEFIAPIVRIPEWRTLAAISVLLAGLLLGTFYAHSRALRTRGKSLLAVVAYTCAAAAVWIAYEYSQKYLTFSSILLGTILLVGTLGAIALLLAEALEWAEAQWMSARRREFETSAPQGAAQAKVSIHVPAYNEPPQMLIATLDALARLDYSAFEVIVVDNNTRDEAAWRPVEAHCRKLGERFRFFHVAPLAGFKAGALNYALQRTAPDAELVAVIDSDYRVDSAWLRDLTPPFADPAVAIVQAPQDYRDEGESLFKAMCYAEYRGFFHIGMVTRNERNAIIQHGTMTLVRRAALERVGGWAEWSITEDAELGLRLFENGYVAHYQPRSYGRGLVPDSFYDYKKQRFRWAYGAVQILRRHADVLLRSDPRLTSGQRYHFIAGWLPWLADGVNLLFNLAAIGWSIAMILAPTRFDPPLIMFSVLPLALFTFKLLKLAHLYASRIGANIRQTLAAAVAGLALSHTIGLAVVKAAFTKHEPFFRTPKGKRGRALLKGLAAARSESLMLIALWLCAFALTRQLDIGERIIGIPEELKGPDVSIWVAVLLIQSISYAAALFVSLVSTLRLPARWLGATKRMAARVAA